MTAHQSTFRRRLLAACVLWTIAAGGELFAQDPVAPVSRRFASDAAGEVPSFQRHVVPLLGRLGCNGRECHGSFQGQGGFRLSLFGYDFAADRAALVEEGRGRVLLDDHGASLILTKPTLEVDHEGGERFKPDSWQYRLLRHWIAAGAPAGDQPTTLESLAVEPAEIGFTRLGETAKLHIVAHWSDGTREDVTPLCRFRSNDDSICTISEAGEVTATGAGDSHVVVFYDNGITPIPVLLPVSDAIGPRYPDVPAPTNIDRLVLQKLRKVGIVPSGLCTDAEFLRRASLDITGTLPLPDEVAAFLAEPSQEKRAKKIDELLTRPAYAAWWTTRLCDLFGNSEQNLPVGGEQGVNRQKSEQWYDWVYRRIEQNVPYDQIVEGVVLGRSRKPDQSVEEYFEEMTSYFRKEHPADFAARDSMPYFWTRGRFSPPQPLRFSYAFLGVRLECAQCHKHPYDQWTKADHDGFQAFFDGVGWNYGASRGLTQERKTALGLTADQDSAGYKKLFAELAAEGKPVPWQEVTVSSLEKRLEKARRTAKISGGRVFTPRVLGGEEVLAAEFDDCRAPLMEWLRQPDNPYFARAIVNRVWANNFGVGIVDPPDDMNLANPASNEPLLSYLATEFIAHGYDLKWLHREIAGSYTYQRSWRPNETNGLDERNFSRALVRRMPAEVAYDALVQATAGDEKARAWHSERETVRTRAIGVSSGYSGRYEGNYAVNLFGKPPRDGICDCDRSNEPSLLQTVYLRNDAELLSLLDQRDGWLKQIAAKGNEWLTANQDEAVQQAYLRTFGRPASDAELETARVHLQLAVNRQSGLRDLLWALLNSKEFILNH